MAAKKTTRPAQPEVRFDQRLVLNQWLISQFGFDPLISIKKGKGKLRALEALSATLRDVPEGLTTDNLHHFFQNARYSLAGQGICYA